MNYTILCVVPPYIGLCFASLDHFLVLFVHVYNIVLSTSMHGNLLSTAADYQTVIPVCALATSFVLKFTLYVVWIKYTTLLQGLCI